MRYRATFIAGFAVGYVFGARAGRERYEQIVSYTRKIAEHPAVQQASQTVTAKATEYSKTAMDKAPDFVKTAATKIPSRLRGNGGSGNGDPGDGAADGRLGYPADGTDASVNGIRYTDTPAE